MKKLIIYSFLGVLFFTSCKEDDSLTESQLDTSTPELSELDQWIKENYVDTYNMEIVYKWNEYEFDLNRYLYPPETDSMLTALKVVKKTWIDSYTEAGGENFIKNVAPRKLVFAGGAAVNTDGTRTLGLAEGGKKITFFETDDLNANDETSVRLFIATVMHEYTHILNQIKPYDKQAWTAINPGEYTAAWYNEDIADSQALGFVSSYARLNVDEDIAETLKMILLDTCIQGSDTNFAYDSYEDFVTSQNAEAQEKLRMKENIIAEYLKNQYNVDLYELQADVQANIQYVLDNY